MIGFEFMGAFVHRAMVWFDIWQRHYPVIFLILVSILEMDIQRCSERRVQAFHFPGSSTKNLRSIYNLKKPCLPFLAFWGLPTLF